MAQNSKEKNDKIVRDLPPIPLAFYSPGFLPRGNQCYGPYKSL